MIIAEGLRKTFSTRAETLDAVTSVDLDVRAGEIVGFLGPNGAGKTTTLRMLTTLLVPTGGTATVAGHDLATDTQAVRRASGYVAQGQASEPEAKLVEELVVQARMYGLDRATAASRAAALLNRLDLSGMGQRLVKTLSGGQRRRLEVALGLVHRPTLVFLDEPSTGLDPQSRANLWHHIRDLRDTDGLTVFLTTHYLDEADALCDRVIIIDEGRIVARGTPAELKRTTNADQVAFEVDALDLDRARHVIDPRLNGQHVILDGHTLRFGLADAGNAVVELIGELRSDGITPRNLEVRPATLDDVFLTLSGRSLREAGSGSTPAEVPA